MKRVQLERWASQLQPPRNPRLQLLQRCPFSSSPSIRPDARKTQSRQYQVRTLWRNQRGFAESRRKSVSTTTVQVGENEAEPPVLPSQLNSSTSTRSPISHETNPLSSQPFARRSAKLSALHARLSLPSKLPLQTLARCLIDPSADPKQQKNNASLALLGQDLLSYYTTEWLLCHYPRLPMPVLFAAQYAYAGPATLAAMRAEWGVEAVAAPGPEVDPGLLQLQRMTPGNSLTENGYTRVKELPSARRLGTGRRNEAYNYRRGVSSRIVYDDEFGDLQTGMPDTDAEPYVGAPISTPNVGEQAGVSPEGQSAEASSTADGITLEAASAGFIRALTGALHLHCGASAGKDFHAEHILSRHLPLHTLFAFTHPTRDLSRLCAREGFEPPVARLISETGRHSRSPVFVVGVFSGEEKLGEGAGSSLNEARVRAAAAALRAWYLYSPPSEDVVLPSEVEGAQGKQRKWKPQMVDVGEIVT